MIGLLIVTHEGIGQSYVDLVRHFFGSVPDCLRILSVDHTQSTEEISAQITEKINHWSCDGILILTDIFGATPSNLAQKCVQKNKISLISGLNAPMIVKAAQYAASRTDLSAFAQELRDCACEGILLIEGEP